MTSAPVYHRSTLAELDPVTLYRLLWLRSRVFDVEQAATDADIDGRELEPGTELWWADVDGVPVAFLRTMVGSESVTMGRLATEAAWRGRGIASGLLERALARHGGRRVDIHAQAHLAQWYAGFGFVVTGPGFVEAGIDHVPMSRGPGLVSPGGAVLD